MPELLRDTPTIGSTEDPSAAGQLPESGARARSGKSVTWRSLLLGTVGSILVCALVPYNDFVLTDTSLAAGYLPLAAVVLEFLLIVGLNAPLHRWAPRHALREGELAVVLLMVLVACSLPNWGLMRFFIPTPVAPFYLGSADPNFWAAFTALDLPSALFPIPAGEDGRISRVVSWFYMSVPGDEKAPYGAWLVPLATWGIFIGAMLATVAAMAHLVLEQWAGNERLPFPLVQIQADLIEQPAPGRALNALLRSPALWVGIGVIFAIHGLRALNTYQPTYFPQIPLGYDLSNIFADEPFVYLRNKVKSAQLSFMVVGVTYFIRSKVAFSLWGIYLLVNLVDVQAGMMRSEMSSAIWQDQHLGACIAFVGGILWIGRHQWLRICRNALWMSGDKSYRISFWVAAVGTIVMLAWLIVLGVQWWMALLIVGFILVTHLIVARVVAETGIPFYRTGISTSQVYTNLPIGMIGGRDVYFAGVFTILGPLTTRDGVMGLTLHGLGVTRSAGVREPRRVGAVIAWTLIVGCVVAAAATLYCQYGYSTPITRDAVPQRNNFGAVYVPERDMGDGLVEYHSGRFPPSRHNSFVHIGTGFLVTVGLEIASLRWANWPLLPVGFVTSYGAFIQNVWLSIFVGWLAKVMILQYGGATLFQRARPLFVGVIFGEALAAGFWLIVNGILVFSGYESQTVRILL